MTLSNRVKTPNLLQFSSAECGIISLAIIFQYYGYYITVDQLRQTCGVTRDGSKASVLVKVAREHGFQADGYRLEIDDLAKSSIPTIVFWNFNHYIVVNYIHKDKVSINDPEIGERTLSIDEFSKGFTGIAIVIVPTEKVNTSAKRLNRNQYVELLGKLLTGDKQTLSFLLFCEIAVIIFTFYNAGLSKIFVQSVLQRTISWIPFISIAVAIILFMTLIIVRFKKVTAFSFKFSLLLRKSIMAIDHVLKLPCFFYALRSKSEVTAILAQLESVYSSFIDIILNNFLNFAVLIVSGIYLFWLDTSISLSLSFFLLLVAVITITIARLKFDNDRILAIASTRLYSTVFNAFSKIETIKSSSLHRTMQKKIQTRLFLKISVLDRSHNLIIYNNLFDDFANTMFIVLIFYLGLHDVSMHYIEIGDLIIFYSIGIFFFSGFKSILNNVINLQTSYSHKTRIDEILANSQDPRYYKEFNKLTENNEIPICIKAIEFSYNKNEFPVISSLNFTVKKGQHIAIIGRSGAGKSTLGKLLAGLYVPNSGEIQIFGQATTNVNPSYISANIAYVTQETRLFTANIKDNLTVWKETDDELVVEALKICCIEDLLDGRLNSKITQIALSGGEIQRIALATAIIQNTPIIILDEPTSFLDIKTEDRIIKNLRSLNKTIILISHRLATIQHCDNIIVMDQGNLVEQGNHNELMNNRCIYFKLYQGEFNE